MNITKKSEAIMKVAAFFLAVTILAILIFGK